MLKKQYNILQSKNEIKRYGDYLWGHNYVHKVFFRYDS